MSGQSCQFFFSFLETFFCKVVKNQIVFFIFQKGPQDSKGERLSGALRATPTILYNAPNLYIKGTFCNLLYLFFNFLYFTKFFGGTRRPL